MSSQIVQSCFQIFVVFSGECLFSCVFHKLKYFSKISCVSKCSDSFLQLKYLAFLMVCTCGHCIHTRNTIFKNMTSFREILYFMKIQENKHSPFNATHSFFHSFIHFHQSITRSKKPEAYSIGHNSLYLTVIHKFNM